MNPQDAREQLSLFPGTLPDKVFSALLDKGVEELYIIPTDIAAKQGLVIYETGGICEGVLKVLKGEESPSNFLAFIQRDERIEEDNREKLPELAYEIQTKLFDPVLPILKAGGFPIKEGRVPAPIVRATAPETAAGSAPSTPEALQAVRSSLSASPLEEKNMRALLRIAAGTVYNEQQLRDAFEELPVGLRQSLSSVDTANAIQEIAKKYLLHVDQMAALASETGLVLLGLTHPAEFIENLSTRLRLPEEKSKEIARDVSAQILVKVREALRGLHEESPKSESPRPTLQSQSSVGQGNPKQTQIGNNQNQPNQSREPLKKLEVMPQSGIQDSRFKIQENVTPRPAAGTPPLAKTTRPTGADGEGLPKSNTPYSSGAKWNTDENILSKQAGGPLSRGEVLRGIENPRTIPAVQKPVAPPLPSTPTLRQKSSISEVVGPTGWKPGQSDVPRPTLQSQSSVGQGSSKVEENSRPAMSPIPPRTPVANIPLVPNVSPARLPKYPINKLDSAETKSRPNDTVAFAPAKPKPEPQDFLDQKLEAPMSVPRDEKRYTADPYREPLQ